MPRRLIRLLTGIIFVVALVYPADWAVWQMRGGATGAVLVTQFTVASLKGKKEEYYSNGAAATPCSLSVFPQNGNGACWWVRRHAQVFLRY